MERYYEYFDAFIILHGKSCVWCGLRGWAEWWWRRAGADTMAYTASALSFMLENLGKPVVLTGSQASHRAPLVCGARPNTLCFALLCLP